MTFSEFRQWAKTALGVDVSSHAGRIHYVCWPNHRADTGTGNDADYGVIEQRRLAAYLRGRDLLPAYGPGGDRITINDWLTAAEPHEDGWLINTGDGIEWQATPDWLKLIEIGCFVGIRCGI